MRWEEVRSSSGAKPVARRALWLACVLALGACSVMPAYEQPSAALDTPLSQAAGWHLAAGADSANGTEVNAKTTASLGANANTNTSAGEASAAGRRVERIPVVGSPSVASPPVPVVGLLSGSPLFNDPVLDAMLQDLSTQNLHIQQAAARLRQAEAALSGAGAGRWPQLGGSLGGRRSGGSGLNASVANGSGAVAAGSASGAANGLGAATGSAADGAGNGNGGTIASRGVTGSSGPRNSFSAGASISWMPDLWGRVSAQVAASEASLAVAEADRQAVVLQMQLNLVQAYWRLRLAEARLSLLARSIETAERSLQLTRNQYEAGLVARADVIQAETQWQGLVTQRHGLARNQLIEQHAIAALLGKTPASFKLPAAKAARNEQQEADGTGEHLVPTLPAAPELPETLSIDLLRRRPDVRAAERRVAAANANLGIAQGAWLPDLSFSSALALGADTLSDLIASPLRTWSLGSQLAAVIFDGGARRAELARQEAAYDETVAGYRQQVLTAVQEIEDYLLAHRTLALQLADQQRLVSLAEASERVVRNRYRSGLVNYLELATAQRLTINSQDELLNLQAERLAVHAGLLAALGGRW